MNSNWQALLQGPVAVLLGGDTAEREISLQTGRAVLASLQAQNINAVAIDTRDKDWPEKLMAGFKHCFIALHGTGGEDGKVQGFLDSVGISYTGSGVMASALAMDKVRAKQLWQGIGLATPEFKVLTSADDCRGVVERWGKAIIKPVHEGSSIGMKIASSEAEMLDAFDVAKQYDSEVMAEQYIDGAEFTIAVIGSKALPVIRLETNNSFYDFDAKYISEDTRYLTPCGLTAEKERELQQISIDAFESLGCEGWGRVDIMQNEKEEFLLLEVNTVPGLTSHSLVPIAAKNMGMGFDEMVAEILRLSVQ